jgi:heat shock protein HtpX
VSHSSLTDDDPLCKTYIHEGKWDQMRSRFEPDRRLAFRMLLTMFLLGLLYVAFVAVLVAVLKSWIIVVFIAAALLAAQYWLSDRIALFAMHGRVVTPREEPELHGIIDRLCALANMPKPRVAVADMDLPNAFATGRNADHAVVCVTTGLLRRLEPEELEGVLAHELSHVAHRDVSLITVASFVGVLAGLLGRFALYSQMFGGRGSSGRCAAKLVPSTALTAALSVGISLPAECVTLRWQPHDSARSTSAASTCGKSPLIWGPIWGPRVFAAGPVISIR